MGWNKTEKIENKPFQMIILALGTLAILVYITVSANPLMIPKISESEAESIALNQAEEDGFLSPTIWNRFDSKTSLGNKYSIKEDRDVRVWSVYIDTIDNPYIKNTPAAVYYIHSFNGEVVSIVSGIEGLPMH